MAQRNIGGDPNDFSYRYKMPCLTTKVEGRGNGIKTRIVNMVDVARALDRNPAYVTKYFGCELGAQSKMEEKTGLSVVNGKHDTKTFDKLLDDFISKWVLCPNCSLPETYLYIKRKEYIYSHCAACGADNMCDMTHKLAAFIIRTPPVKKKASKASKAKEQIEKIQAGEVSNAEQLSINRKDSEIEWSADTSQDAVKKRQQKALGDKLKDLALVEDNTIDEFKNFRKEKHTSKEIITFVTQLQKREQFSNDRRVTLLFDTFYDKNILKQIKDSSEVVKHFCVNSRSQGILLGRFEMLLASNPPLLKSVKDILNAFYEFEILSEEVLIDWHDVPSAKYVTPEVLSSIHKSAQPFIEWLKNADEEGDSEEEPQTKKVEEKKTKVIKQVDSDSDDDAGDLDDL